MTSSTLLTWLTNESMKITLKAQSHAGISCVWFNNIQPPLSPPNLGAPYHLFCQTRWVPAQCKVPLNRLSCLTCEWEWTVGEAWNTSEHKYIVIERLSTFCMGHLPLFLSLSLSLWCFWSPSVNALHGLDRTVPMAKNIFYALTNGKQ